MRVWSLSDLDLLPPVSPVKLVATSSSRYKQYEDGFYRLQMVRFESAELSEQLTEENRDSFDHDLLNDGNRILGSSTVDNTSMLGISAAESASNPAMGTLMDVCADLTSLSYLNQNDPLSMPSSSSVPRSINMGLSKGYVDMLQYYESAGAVSGNDLQFADGQHLVQLNDAGNFDLQGHETTEENLLVASNSEMTMVGNLGDQEASTATKKSTKKSYMKAAARRKNSRPKQKLNAESLMRDTPTKSSSSSRRNARSAEKTKTTPDRRCKSSSTTKDKQKNNKMPVNTNSITGEGASVNSKIDKAVNRQLPFSIDDLDSGQCQNHVTVLDQSPTLNEKSSSRRKRLKSGSERPRKLNRTTTKSETDAVTAFNNARQGEQQEYEQVILDVSRTLLSLHNSDSNDGKLLGIPF